MFGNAVRWVVVGVMVMGAVAACADKKPKVLEGVKVAATPAASAADPVAADAAAGAKVEGLLATVDGVPIAEIDIRYALKLKDEESVPAADRAKVLNALIQKQVLANAALKAGLGKDADYQRQVRNQETMLAAFKRNHLSVAYHRQVLAAKAEPSDAEVLKFFEDNKARIQTEVHVWQIRSRDEAKIKTMQTQLKEGVAFGMVAAASYGAPPEAGLKPWDLGYMKYKQVPPEWRGLVYEMKVGDVSEVIVGKGGRRWLIKLAGKRTNPELTFDTVKDIIKADLRDTKLADGGQAAVAELRKAAKIVMVPAPKAD